MVFTYGLNFFYLLLSFLLLFQLSAYSVASIFFLKIIYLFIFGCTGPLLLQCRRLGFDPWRSEWQPTPVFLPGESHGQKSLAGYSPWGRRAGHN